MPTPPHSVPPQSLPPPSPPPEVFARARIRALEQELESVEDARCRAMYLFELGALHEMRLGDRNAALSRYREASRAWPRFLPALLSQVLLLSRTERYTEAANAWRLMAEATLVPADRAAALCELGIMARNQLGDVHAALDAWKSALRADPSCITAALLLEQERRSLGDERGALQAVQAHLDAASDPQVEAALLLEVALAHERHGELQQATERVLEARDLRVDPLAVRLQLERLARKAGRPAERVQALRGLAEHAQALAKLGAEQWGRGRAAALYREAARAQGSELSDWDGAMDSFARALSARPGDALVLRERALSRRRQGDLEGAADDLEALLEDSGFEDDDAALLLLEIAAVRREQGDTDRARKALGRAISADPRSAAALAMLEDSLLADDDAGALVDHLERRALSLADDARARTLLRAGTIALRHGDGERALRCLRTASQAASDPRSALRELYGACLRLDLPAEAAAALHALCGLEQGDAERGALRLHEFLLQRRAGDDDAAREVLAAAVDDAACADWAPEVARVAAARAGERRLLARAHRRLAEAAPDAGTAAAHLAAAARASLRAGDDAEATADLRAGLEREPDEPYSLALLERLLLSGGEAAEAARLLRDAAGRRADERERELALLRTAAAAEAAGDPRAAAAAFREAGELPGARLSAAWGLLTLSLRAGDGGLRDEALGRLAALEAETGQGGATRLQLAESAVAAGELTRAREAARQAMAEADVATPAALALWTAAEPGESDAALERLAAGATTLSPAFTRLRVAAARRRDPAAARELLEQAREAGAGDGELSLDALLCATGDRERIEALRELGRALGDGPAGAELSLHAVRAGLCSGDDELASEALVRAPGVGEHAPRSLPAAVAMDETLLAGEDPDARAGALFARLSHTTPQHAGALRAARTRALLAAGRAREAADAARRALADDPDAPGPWEVLREAGAVLGDWDTVAEAAERLADLVDGALRAALLEEAAGVSLHELNDGARAERDLRAALQADPERRGAFDRLHDLLVARDDLGGLVELLDDQLARETDDARRLDLGVERALALRAAGDADGCLAALAEVAQARDDHAPALALQAEVLTTLERWQDAVSALRRLADSDAPPEERRRARIEAADLLEHRLQEPGQAREELIALREAGEQDGELLVRAARLAEEAGYKRWAADDCREAARVLGGAHAAELLTRAGEMSRELGEPEQARESFERALQARPTHEPALRGLWPLLKDDDARRDELAQGFEAAVLEALQHEPENPALLRALRHAGELRQDASLRRRALTMLAALGLADDDERAALGGLPSDGKARLGSQLDAQATELDSRVHRVAQLVAPLSPDTSTFERGRVPEVDDGVLRALDGLAARAELEVATRHRGDEGQQLDLVLEHRGGLAWVLGEGLDELSEAQRFGAARLLVAARLGVMPLSRGERAARLRWLRIALSAGGALPSGDPELIREGKTLGKQLGRRGRKQLDAALEGMDAPVDRCEAYLEALDRICDRGALLLCDTPAGMISARLGDGDPDLDVLAATPDALDLLRFWAWPDRPSAGEAADEHAMQDGDGDDD
jgi:tetratricopeptide (TPR) repeat protein